MLLIGKKIRGPRGRTNDHQVEKPDGKQVEVSKLFYVTPEEIRAEESSQHQPCGGGRRIIRKQIGGA